MLKWIYLGFAACFWLGRCYEAERQDALRVRGTFYKVERRRKAWKRNLWRRVSARWTRRSSGSAVRVPRF